MKENKRRRWDRLARLGLLCLLLLLCAGCARDGEDAASGEGQADTQETAGEEGQADTQETAGGENGADAQETAGEEGQADHQETAGESQADTQETAGGENGAAPQEPQGGGEDNAPAIDRGNAFLEAGDMEQAAACFEEAIAAEQDLRMAYRGLGIVKLSQGDYEGAIADFDQALVNCGMEADAVAYDISYYKASAYVSLGELNEALEVYSHLVDYKPSADTYMGRGAVYARMGNLEMARADFDRVLQEEPDNYSRYVEAYQLLEAAGQTEAGQEYLRRALEIERDKNADNLERGKLYYYLQEYDNAKTELERADESDAEVLLYKGLVYDALGDFAYAKTMYEAYLEQESADGSIYNLIASSEMASGNYEDALATVQRGLANASSGRQELYRNEIIAYEYLGDFASAKAKMEEYLEMYPQDEEAAREAVFLRTRS